MAIRIGTNIASLQAQRRLNEAGSGLVKSFERLSSGLRINSPSDDTAGLSVASSIKTDSRVFSQGIRNINDAFSYLSIADSALSSLSGIMTRIQELSEQAANGVFSNEQRAAMDDEARALQDEYNRVIATTTFNGLQIFSSLDSRLVIQAGYSQIEANFASYFPTLLGDGTFEALIAYQFSGGPRGIGAGDLNGDGNLDIVAGMYDTNRVNIMLGNGDGSFKAQACFTAGDSPADVVLGDLNSDGKLDVVVASDNDRKATVFIGNGDGSFRAATSFTVGDFPRGVSLGDLNGDEVLDIVSGNNFGDNFSVLIGNGDGTFKAQACFQGGDGATTPLPVDINGDGKLDLVGTNPGSNNVSILIGAGNGTFAAQTCYQVGGGPYAVQAVDFNRDGRLDLVVGNYNSNTISVLLGNGDGTFRSQTCFEAGVNVRYIDNADLNGDGNVDLLASNTGSNNLSVFFGNGDGTFKAQVCLALEGSPRGVLLDDINNDGVSDLIAANFDGNSSCVALGGGRPGLMGVDLTTQSAARSTLALAQEALAGISLVRGMVGASESRFASALNGLSAMRETYESAYSRVMDADIVEESAELVRRQILQQTAAAVLAQANQAPALALKLLAN